MKIVDKILSLLERVIGYYSDFCDMRFRRLE